MAKGPKRKVSPQTRVKLKQAAQKRRRAPKGSEYGGRFIDGFSRAKPLRAYAEAPFGGRPKGPKGVGKSRKYDINPDVAQETYQSNLAAAKAGPIRPEDYAYERTVRQLNIPRGEGVRPTRDQTATPPMRVTSVGVRQVTRAEREGKWQTEAGLYQNDPATRTRRARTVPVSKFVKEELAPSHRTWFDTAMNDPRSPFNAGLSMDNTTKGKYTPGARNRARLYVDALQRGASHQEAIRQIQTEKRGRKPGTARRTTGLSKDQRATGRKGKYESVAPTSRELQVGISAPRVDKINELRKKFPDATDKDLVRVQQNQREAIFDEFLRNQKWVQETRASQLKGDSNEKVNSNKVVFFTTSIGHPAPSVPADSLVGQYIIRRRKKMLRKEGVARAPELQGEFPDAVRDMHVVELSTGLSLGAEGRYGLFQKSGWRAGTKKSRNFGKPVPFGSQIVYDSQGRPMYDSEGNIRYTEGVTRPFKFETTKDAGLRVFIG